MVELPSHIVLPIVMAVITYFMVGYQLAADKFWRVFVFLGGRPEPVGGRLPASRPPRCRHRCAPHPAHTPPAAHPTALTTRRWYALTLVLVDNCGTSLGIMARCGLGCFLGAARAAPLASLCWRPRASSPRASLQRDS